MQVIGIDPLAVDKAAIRRIGLFLRRDGVIAYPTETFYGLGAAADSDKAVRRIYRLKRREPRKPLSVIVSDLDMLRQIIDDLPPVGLRLAREFWPGPLTLILKTKPSFASPVLGPSRSLGVRVPGPAWLRALVREVAFPITATSANISGRNELSDPGDVIRLFRGKVDLVVDGGRTEGVAASTVINLTAAEPTILREGAIPAEALREYLAP